jgi:hypothetical protein
MQMKKNMNFAISVTSPDITSANFCPDGGLASAPIMLHHVGIMSPLLSSTQ